MNDDLTKIRAQMPLTVQASTYWTARWFSKLPKEKRMTFLVSVLNYVLGLDFLDKYRTRLGGIASLLGGVTYLVLVAAGNPEGSVEKGIAAIILGVTVIGAAGKADKALAATKAAAVIQAAVAGNPVSNSVIDEYQVADALEIITAPAPNSTPVTKGE